MLLLSLACVLVAGTALAKEDENKDPMHIKDGILDEIRLSKPTIPADAVVVMRLFSTEGTELGTGAEGGKKKRVEAVKTILADGPQMLAESFKKELEKRGPFPEVRIDDGTDLPDNAVVIEGRFTMIDPGSRAKRYFVGFGSGKSGTEVQGTVKNSAGELLAEFTQKRIAVMGAFGGSYVKKMTKDTRSIGEDIAEFLSEWAQGESLED
jgi:hypothetical protein